MKNYRYDPETGDIYNVISKKITKRKTNGYILLSNNIYGHQFAFFSVYGYIPKCIDHINQIKDDNRISNLRDIPKKQNHYNTKAKGCSYNKHAKKWEAYINKDGIRYNLGLHDTEELAHNEYLSYKNKIHTYG